MRSALTTLSRPLRALGRALRFVFGPILPEAWIYAVFPAVYLVGAIGGDWGRPLEHYAVEFCLAFTWLACVGLPMHLWYGHFGDRVLGPRFRWREIPIHAAVIVPSAVFGTEVAYRILVPLLATPDVSQEVLTGLRRAGWVAGSVGGALTTAALLSLSRYRMRVEEVELREVAAQGAAVQAQLEALQARIQPHFLFNCLNTVAGLIEDDPGRAEEAVERLSDLFRYTLESSKVSALPLSQELAIVRDYVALESLRYGDRLKAAIHVDPRAEAVRVPPLVLQPVVENAVLHAVAPRRTGGRIEVVAKIEGEQLVLTVDDDGPGPGHSSHAGSGTALADLRRRLDLLCGDAARVEQCAGPLGGFRLRIELPLVLSELPRP